LITADRLCPHSLKAQAIFPGRANRWSVPSVIQLTRMVSIASAPVSSRRPATRNSVRHLTHRPDSIPPRPESQLANPAASHFLRPAGTAPGDSDQSATSSPVKSPSNLDRLARSSEPDDAEDHSEFSILLHPQPTGTNRALSHVSCGTRPDALSQSFAFNRRHSERLRRKVMRRRIRCARARNSRKSIMRSLAIL